MLCEVCEVHSNSLAKLPYDKYKCIKPRCNEKGSHFHEVCIKCCDKNNSNQIKKSMSKLESNKIIKHLNQTKSSLIKCQMNRNHLMKILLIY